MSKSLPEIFESFTSVMELLRNEQFQKLLVDYERAKKVFLVGYEVQDDVSSMTLFEAEGRYGLKPEDYLLAFSEFVKNKENEIDSLHPRAGSVCGRIRAEAGASSADGTDETISGIQGDPAFPGLRIHARFFQIFWAGFPAEPETPRHSKQYQDPHRLPKAEFWGCHYQTHGYLASVQEVSVWLLPTGFHRLC